MPASHKKILREIVGKNVRVFRIARGWSQTELADRAEWTQKRISLLESYKLSATMDSLEALAIALGKSPSDLFIPHKG